MSDSAISALTLATSGLGADEFAIGDVGTSEKITLSQISKFTNASGIFISLASDASAQSTTAMVRVSGMDVTGIDAGTYVFEYYIRAQFVGATQSIKFAVNHTGTTTSFMYNFFYPQANNTQTVGAIDQTVNQVQGSIWAFQATRIKNTTLGPETSVETSADIMFRIMGTMIVTVTGTLELYAGGEINASSFTIMSGTSLILKKVG